MTPACYTQIRLTRHIPRRFGCAALPHRTSDARAAQFFLSPDLAGPAFAQFNKIILYYYIGLTQSPPLTLWASCEATRQCLSNR